MGEAMMKREALRIRIFLTDSLALMNRTLHRKFYFRIVLSGLGVWKRRSAE